MSLIVDLTTATILNYDSYSVVIDYLLIDVITRDLELVNNFLLALHNIKLNLEFETKYKLNKNCVELIDVLVAQILVRLPTSQCSFKKITIQNLKQLITTIKEHNNHFINCMLQILLKFCMFEVEELNTFSKHNPLFNNSNLTFKQLIFETVKKMMCD